MLERLKLGVGFSMGRLSFTLIAAVIFVSFLLSLAATEHFHDKGIHINKEDHSTSNARLLAGEMAGKQSSNSVREKKSEVTLEWLKKSDQN